MLSPIRALRVRHFWNKSIRESNGVCVFGEAPDTWMLRYQATETNRAKRTTPQGYIPIGKWTVVEGPGRYAGITGAGTYLAEGAVGEGGKYRTRWEGSVNIPD